jgi:signal transduction histidine kinase
MAALAPVAIPMRRSPFRLVRPSLSLQFAAAAFITLAAGMTGLGSWVSLRIEEGVVQNTATSTAFYMDSLMGPLVQPLATEKSFPPSSIEGMDKIMTGTAFGKTFAAVKIWLPNGVIIYSNEKALIGKSFPETRGFRKAMTGKVAAQFSDLDEDENELERAIERPLLEIYAPIHQDGTLKVIGVAELYQYGDDLAADIYLTRQTTVLLVGSFALGMLGVLYGIVRVGSKTIYAQRAALEQRIGELDQLLHQNQELHQHIAAARRRTYETNERLMRRVGADLHDGPAQLVALSLLLLGFINPKQETKDEASQSEAFEKIKSVLGEALSELRALSAGIAPPELHTVTLVQAIKLATENHEKWTGTKVNCRIGDLPDVSALVKTALYRFTQEGLTNTFRHAAGATPTVAATASNDSIEVMVVDSGPGMPDDFKPAPSALGLAGLRDRLESLGGTLEIMTRPGFGTRLLARFALGNEAPPNV